MTDRNRDPLSTIVTACFVAMFVAVTLVVLVWAARQIGVA